MEGKTPHGAIFSADSKAWGIAGRGYEAISALAPVLHLGRCAIFSVNGMLSLSVTGREGVSQAFGFLEKNGVCEKMGDSDPPLRRL